MNAGLDASTDVAVDGGPGRLPDRSRSVPAVAAAVTILLLVLADRYGPHRDELYFIAAGHHLQWGYPDQPPLTPLIALLADQVAHGSLLALRFVPALIAGAVVLLTAGFARELGGDRRAQLLTAITLATGAGVLAIGHLLETTTLDLLAWTVVIRLLVAVLHRDTPRGWLLVGLATGIGLENKSLIGPLVAALTIGILVTPSVRHHLRSPWFWGGAGIAAVLALPNLWWQASHGWPQSTLAGSIRDEYETVGGILQLIVLQFVILSLLASVLIVVGLVALWRRREWDFARPVAVAYVVLNVFLLITGGKEYYLIGLLGMLAAAGSVVLVQNWSFRRVVVFGSALAVLALALDPGFVPVLPVKTFANSFYAGIDDDGLETVGWPRVVDQVHGVIAALPAAQRATAVVVTLNYGEAGALEWYGGSPSVFSGHNGFGDWGPPTSPGPVIYVGEQAPAANALTGCRRAATLNTGVDNEENGHGIWVCTGPAGSWPQAWKRLRHLSA